MPLPDLATLLDAGRALTQELGSFWTGVYNGAGLVYDLCCARQQAELQTTQLLEETSQCAGLATVPVLARQLWWPVTLLQSQQLPDTRLVYGTTDPLGPATTILNNRTYDYPVPATLQELPNLLSTPGLPQAFLTRGVEYILDRDRSAVRFFTDPFQDPRFQPDTVYDAAGQPADRQLVLLGFQAGLEKYYLSDHFATTAGVALPDSSAAARTAVGATWSGLLKGPSIQELTLALAGLCDAPICLQDGEIVQELVTEPGRLLVVTDRTVYTAVSGASVVIQVGQVLTYGAPLTDAFTLLELARGTPAAIDLNALMVPPALLGVTVNGGLTFTNALTPLQVTSVGGRTRVSWALGGDAGDQVAFWDRCHTLGTAVGARSLAQLLDRRPQPQTTDPDANDLPSVINPLDFLVRNILRYGAVVVRYNPTSFGPQAARTSVRDSVLRQLVGPSWTLLPA
jgi:hypothetical protein